MQNFELFKAGIGSNEFTKVINENEHSQYEFLSNLKKSKFTPVQILELIKAAKDAQIKSLLITHLLSQQTYLDSLAGESLLARLNNSAFSHSRLNALVHDLDIRTLTVSLIEELQPEAAASLLCSVPHFHQLKQEHVEALLKKNNLRSMINYWLNHFASMPNAHFTFAHIIKLAAAEMGPLFKKMDEVKRLRLLTNMIEHLELFDPMEVLQLERPIENQLLIAIRLFLKGHIHPNYIIYINYLTQQLQNQNHKFSSESIRLLISLNRFPEFNQLTIRIANITNLYLKTAAQSGDIGLFNDTYFINPVTMTQPVQLKPSTTTNPAKGMFSSMMGGSAKPDHEEQLMKDEHPVITDLVKQNKPINTFDYFLIHYKGSRAKISKVISDYLGYFSLNTNEPRSKNIYHISSLMLSGRIEPLLKDAIFTAFLQNPELFDAQISYSMFRYDAKRMIQHFGLQGGIGNYKRVIDLCTGALTHLNPKTHQDLINIAHTAKAEALLELSFVEEGGFFSRLFRRFIRCWISGWTGFFSPNLPLYVVPEEAIVVGEKPELATPNKYISPSEPIKSLNLLIEETKSKHAQSTLDAIVNTLKNYSLKAYPPQDEIIIRQKIHTLFHNLLKESKKNSGLSNWLNRQQESLIENSFRFSELLFQIGDPQIKVIINEVNERSSQMKQLSDELFCDLPVQLTEVTTKEEPQAEDAMSRDAKEFIETATEAASTYAKVATEYFNSATSYASGFTSSFTGFFSNPGQIETPQTSSTASPN